MVCISPGLITKEHIKLRSRLVTGKIADGLSNYVIMKSGGAGRSKSSSGALASLGKARGRCVHIFPSSVSDSTARSFSSANVN